MNKLSRDLRDAITYRDWKLDADKPYELRQPSTWQEIAVCAVEVLEKRSDVRAPQDNILAFTENGVPIYSTGGGRRGRRGGGGGGNGNNAGPAALPPSQPEQVYTLAEGHVKPCQICKRPRRARCHGSSRWHPNKRSHPMFLPVSSELLSAHSAALLSFSTC